MEIREVKDKKSKYGNYVVEIDRKEVERIKESIDKTLNEVDAIRADVLSAIVEMAAELCFLAKIQKPQLLNYISEYYETFDEAYVDKEKGE